MTKRLRIGFISNTNPLDRRAWSGVHYSIFKALERHLGEVVAPGAVPMRLPFAFGDRFIQMACASPHRQALPVWLERGRGTLVWLGIRA